MITSGETPLPGWRGADGNAAYLDKTLRHQPIDMGLNESVEGRTIFALWLRAVLISWAVMFIPLVIGFLSLIAGQSNPYDDGSDDGTGSGLTLLGLVLGFAVFVVMLLFTRITEPVAEWRVLLSERHERAPQVYHAIHDTLRRHRYPLQPLPEGTRLKLVMKPYTAYVSVFRYGDDLYLGWMMWRSRRGTELFARYVSDLLLGMRGANTVEHQLLRSEGARAMREAVHLACREGLMIAVEEAGGGPLPDGPWLAPTPTGPSAPAAPPAPPLTPPQAPPTTPPPGWGPDQGGTEGG